MHTSELNSKQIKAIHLLATGMSDNEVAEQVGVSRQTVNKWKNQDDKFIYELGKQRANIWEQHSDYYRSLVPKAIKVLEEGLESEDTKVRIDVAKNILRAVKLEPKPLTKVEEDNGPTVLRVVYDRTPPSNEGIKDSNSDNNSSDHNS